MNTLRAQATRTIHAIADFTLASIVADRHPHPQHELARVLREQGATEFEARREAQLAVERLYRRGAGAPA